MAAVLQLCSVFMEQIPVLYSLNVTLTRLFTAEWTTTHSILKNSFVTMNKFTKLHT